MSVQIMSEWSIGGDVSWRAELGEDTDAEHVRPVHMSMAAPAVAAGPSSSENMTETVNGPTEDSAEAQKRPQFGTRFLTDPRQVFQHNAWCVRLNVCLIHSLQTTITDTVSPGSVWHSFCLDISIGLSKICNRTVCFCSFVQLYLCICLIDWFCFLCHSL